MSQDSYADYPRSVNEVRSDRSGDAADWSPREALLSVLRAVDAGALAPDAIIISYRELREQGYRTSFVAACPDTNVMLGVLETTKFRIWEMSR